MSKFFSLTILPKKIMDKRGGREGVSHFSVGKLLCHCAEGLRRETVCIAENLSIGKQTYA